MYIHLRGENGNSARTCARQGSIGWRREKERKIKKGAPRGAPFSYELTAPIPARSTVFFEKTGKIEASIKDLEFFNGLGGDVDISGRFHLFFGSVGVGYRDLANEIPRPRIILQMSNVSVCFHFASVITEI